MSLENRKTLIKAFIETQINHCPLISMLYSKTLNDKVNRIQERELRTLHSDYKSSFNDLLNKDDFFTIHQIYIQNLASKIYKYLHGLSPTILRKVFKINEAIPYDLRMRNQLHARFPKRVRYGTEAISFLSRKIWALVLQNTKDSSFLTCFKKSTRKWKPNCSCRLWKRFLQHAGFI